MFVFSLTPLLSQLGLAAAALTLCGLAWVLFGERGPDVRTLIRRRAPAPLPPDPVEWLRLTAHLPDEEIRAFLEYARRMRGDFDTLGVEHVQAMYETYRQWERPDLPPFPEHLSVFD